MSTRADRQAVVVGVDDSSTSLNAARWAAYLAANLHAPLLIASALGRRVPAGIGVLDDVRSSHWYGSAREIAYRSVELVRTCEPELTIDTVIAPQSAASALVDLSGHARFLVVGGQTTFGARMTGPTTAHVADHAHCPVVVWRGENGHPIPRDKPVAVGVDGTELSASAIAHGFELAAALGVSLVAVHTWPSRIEPIGRHLDRGEAECVLLAESLAGWRTEYPDVAVTEMSVPGFAPTVLTEIAEQVQLLVVGSRGRGSAISAIAGSTSRDLLHHASCPILICRP
ncbi:universal stress protein [Nocardia sp. NPDC046473]|uniref:universal stress protein n=1 Tax=Nocardia sp. NPDC046473 TaxID=3155733 RepID=UPI00340D15DF